MILWAALGDLCTGPGLQNNAVKAHWSCEDNWFIKVSSTIYNSIVRYRSFLKLWEMYRKQKYVYVWLMNQKQKLSETIWSEFLYSQNKKYKKTCPLYRTYPLYPYLFFLSRDTNTNLISLQLKNIMSTYHKDDTVSLRG